MKQAWEKQLSADNSMLITDFCSELRERDKDNVDQKSFFLKMDLQTCDSTSLQMHQ